MKIQFPAHIQKIETMSDRSVHLKIDKMLELSAEKNGTNQQ